MTAAMLRILAYSLGYIAIFFSIEGALALPRDAVVTRCSPALSSGVLAPLPKPVNYSNNLRRKTGSAREAEGTKVTIKGRVLDTNCVPVQDAVVLWWQADSQGKYPDAMQRIITLDNGSFLSSGRAVTNNLGQFSFITVMPGSAKGKGPHANIQVMHPKMDDVIKTVFYFNKPAAFFHVSTDDSGAEKVIYMDITFDQAEEYKHY